MDRAEAVDLYTRQCSLNVCLVDTVELGVMRCSVAGSP
jgi:hypothetical protein